MSGLLDSGYSETMDVRSLLIRLFIRQRIVIEHVVVKDQKAAKL